MALDSLDLELQMAMSHLVGVLKANSRSSDRAASALKNWT